MPDTPEIDPRAGISEGVLPDSIGRVEVSAARIAATPNEESGLEASSLSDTSEAESPRRLPSQELGRRRLLRAAGALAAGTGANYVLGNPIGKAAGVVFDTLQTAIVESDIQSIERQYHVNLIDNGYLVDTKDPIGFWRDEAGRVKIRGFLKSVPSHLLHTGEVLDIAHMPIIQPGYNQIIPPAEYNYVGYPSFVLPIDNAHADISSAVSQRWLFAQLLIVTLPRVPLREADVNDPLGRLLALEKSLVNYVQGTSFVSELIPQESHSQLPVVTETTTPADFLKAFLQAIELPTNNNGLDKFTPDAAQLSSLLQGAYIQDKSATEGEFNTPQNVRGHRYLIPLLASYAFQLGEEGFIQLVSEFVSPEMAGKMYQFLNTEILRRG